MGRAMDGVMKSTEDERGKASIDLIINLFSDMELEIKRFYREDENFRLLCEDYAVCALALQNMKTANPPPSRERCEEYEQMLAELEREIEVWLQESEIASR
jgi:hypothetical protein